MAAGNARVDRLDLAARHQLRFLDRATDRLHGGFDIDDHAFFQSARGMRAEADDFDITFRVHLADDRNHLGCADIQTDDHVPVGFPRHCATPPVCTTRSHRPVRRSMPRRRQRQPQTKM
jgi:hypothetical protein